MDEYAEQLPRGVQPGVVVQTGRPASQDVPVEEDFTSFQPHPTTRPSVVGRPSLRPSEVPAGFPQGGDESASGLHRPAVQPRSLQTGEERYPGFLLTEDERNPDVTGLDERQRCQATFDGSGLDEADARRLAKKRICRLVDDQFKCLPCQATFSNVYLASEHTCRKQVSQMIASPPRAGRWEGAPRGQHDDISLPPSVSSLTDATAGLSVGPSRDRSPGPVFQPASSPTGATFRMEIFHPPAQPPAQTPSATGTGDTQRTDFETNEFHTTASRPIPSTLSTTSESRVPRHLDKTVCVCRQRKVDVTLLKCGHAVCDWCSPKSDPAKCPVCGANVEDVAMLDIGVRGELN